MLDRKTRRLLRHALGEDNFMEGVQVKHYAVDGFQPQVVLIPRTRDHVERIVVLAHEEQLAVVPWGAGTQMGLGNPPRRVDLVVCLHHLNRITNLDPENMTITADAGIRLAMIQESLSRHGQGFLLPLDPPCGESMTLGGALSTNASGPCRLRYGTLRDMVVGIEVIIPGEVEHGGQTRAGGRTVKNVSGYDMGKLYIGSLGTLGIITEATCRILPPPEDRATVVGAFSGSEDPWRLVEALRESQLLPSCIEFYNRETASFLTTNSNVGFNSEGGAWAAVGFEGISEAVSRQIEDIERLARSDGVKEIQLLRGPREKAFWQRYGQIGFEIRKRNPWSIGLKVAVPLSAAQGMSKSIDDKLLRMDVAAYQLSRGGSGISYAHMPLSEKLYREKEKSLADMVEALREEAGDSDGASVVVEYAPPAFKEKVDVWGGVGGMLPIMERLKKEFDPQAILNPGRYVCGI